MQHLLTYGGDGWFPKISLDGRRVIFGGGGRPGLPPSICVWTRDRGIFSPTVPGRNGRFLSDGTATFTRELDNFRAQRLTIDTNGGTHAIVIPTSDDPNLVGGNDFACGDGWASARVADMRLAVDNHVVPGVAARRVTAHGPHLLVTEGNNEIFTIRPFADPSQVLWRGAVPPTAHFASLGGRDVIGYGYESPFGVLNHPTLATDATALPWRRENNAQVVLALDGTLWAFSSGQRLDTGKGLVIGRPFGDTNVFEVPFDGSGGLDVVAISGGFLIAGCSDEGALQVWEVPYNEARGPIQVVRQAEPVGTPITGYAGYFFDKGRYGDHNAPCNITMLGTGMYEDGDGHKPEDVVDRVVRAAEVVGAIFLAATDIVGIGPLIWPLVHGVWVHEPATPEGARQATTAAQALMDRLKLPRRPVIAVLTTDKALDPAFATVADWSAVEIYHANPASTWAEQVEATEDLIETIETTGVGTGHRPMLLVPQAYDRSSPKWKNSALMLEAIQDACQRAAARFKGLIWFAYARPGGVLDYRALLDWHRAQVAVTTRPKVLGGTPPPDPPPHGGEMTAEDIRRYVAELPDNVLFGAVKRFRDEACLDRDRLTVAVIKAADGTSDFWTGDVFTGGANGYFVRSYISEYLIARDAGKNPLDSSVAGFEAAKKSYKQATNPQ